MSDFTKNLRKYKNYVFDTKSFVPDFDANKVSDHALEVANSIRGSGRTPSIIIHGIMKRSGTVYVGELLSLHPDTYSYPNKIWEIPFLPQTGSIKELQREFFLAYEKNIGMVGENDFLPIFGASFIRYLYAFVPEDRRLLVKMPGVQYLNYFYTVFPGESLLLLTRDGRDVVASTIKTWPQLNFVDVCRRWNHSARMVLECHKKYNGRNGYWLARFEDAVKEPSAFVKKVCEGLELDPDKYPYEKIDSLPVIGSSTTLKDGKGWEWIRKPKGFQPVGRWQHWSVFKKWVFKRVAGKSLIELGYCTDLSW